MDAGGRATQEAKTEDPEHAVVLKYPVCTKHMDVRVKSHQVAEGLYEGDEARRAVRQYFAVMLR